MILIEEVLSYEIYYTVMSWELLNSERFGWFTVTLFERSGYIAQCWRDICSYF